MSGCQAQVRIDHLIRSGRKSISLEINRDGTLTVRAPRFVSQAEIQQLVDAKSSWINKKQHIALKQRQEAAPKQFVEGEQFYYLGRLYTLEIVTDQDQSLVLKDSFLLAAAAQENAGQVFESWYRRQARQVIGERAPVLAEEHGFEYSRVRITSAKTRWGSCGTNQALNFPWRLVMAPAEVIDYVIIHELVHLRIKNHSKRYWQSVSQLMPGYKERKAWLKVNGHRLQLTG